MRKYIDSRIISCVLGLLLAETQTALAEYQPPPDQRPPSSYTSSTGSRGGCESNRGASLTALAPQKHVGQTISERPTFAWFVPDTKSFPVELRLYEFTADGKLKPKPIQTYQLQSSPGIMQLSLSEDKPGLVKGQRYLWQVAILCDPNHPSSDLVAQAEIAVVEMSPTLKTALSNTSDRRKMVDLYAEDGLWYDALSEALRLAEGSRLGEVAASLLNDIVKLEKPEQSEKLNQIRLNIY